MDLVLGSGRNTRDGAVGPLLGRFSAARRRDARARAWSRRWPWLVVPALLAAIVLPILGLQRQPWAVAIVGAYVGAALLAWLLLRRGQLPAERLQIGSDFLRSVAADESCEDALRVEVDLRAQRDARTPVQRWLAIEGRWLGQPFRLTVDERVERAPGATAVRAKLVLRDTVELEVALPDPALREALRARVAAGTGDQDDATGRHHLPHGPGFPLAAAELRGSTLHLRWRAEHERIAIRETREHRWSLAFGCELNLLLSFLGRRMRETSRVGRHLSGQAVFGLLRQSQQWVRAPERGLGG